MGFPSIRRPANLPDVESKGIPVDSTVVLMTTVAGSVVEITSTTRSVSHLQLRESPQRPHQSREATPDGRLPHRPGEVAMVTSARLPTDQAPKPRRRTHPSRYLFVRRLRKGILRVWQARTWLPEPLGSINLGIHEDEWSAHRAVQAWIRAGADPCRGLPDGVLPKWVRLSPDGTFTGWVRLAGELVERGPFPTAEDAHIVMREIVREHLTRRREERKARSAERRALVKAERDAERAARPRRKRRPLATAEGS